MFEGDKLLPLYGGGYRSLAAQPPSAGWRGCGALRRARRRRAPLTPLASGESPSPARGEEL